MPFTRLDAFLAGFALGSHCATDPQKPQIQDFIPEHFTRFVTEHFGLEYPDGGNGWRSLIQQHTSSEHEAFELYFTLLEAYENRQNIG